MGMRIEGLGQTRLDIRQDVERTTRATRRQIEKEAAVIMDLSVANAPVDEGNLEAAHSVVKKTDGNRKMMSVEVGGVVNGVDVDQYALIMHESQYDLGPKSQAKQDETGRMVGAKFLERAYDEREPEMIKNMEDAARKS